MPIQGLRRLDEALRRRLTTQWSVETRGRYIANLRATRDEATDHSAASAMLDQLDTKASGTLTHISMMITALGITGASSITNHVYEGALVYGSISLYLGLAMLCLRVMSAFDLDAARSQIETFATHLAEELIYRKELYRAANLGASIMTAVMFLLMPLLYFF